MCSLSFAKVLMNTRIYCYVLRCTLYVTVRLSTSQYILLLELVEHLPATRCVVGLIPAGGTLKVWPCDLGPKQFDWLINQLGEP